MARPSRAEVRAGGGGLAFFSGSALLLLLTTTPPPGKYYPWWALVLAGAGVVAGLGAVVATLIHPRPDPIEDELRGIRELLDQVLRTRPFVTGWQIENRTAASPETIERAVRGLEAEGKITVQGQVIRGRTLEVFPELPKGIPHRVIAHVRAHGASPHDRAWVETSRQETRRGQDATATPRPVEAKATVPSPTVATGTPFQAPEDTELEVVLEREDFHPFESKAILLEAKIRVRNRTPKTKYVMHTQWEIDRPEEPVHEYVSDVEVHRALYALKEKRIPELHGIIGPNDTIAGWVHVALPWQPWGGIGGFTITIEDEIGAQYTLRREPRGGRKPK